MWDIFDAAWHPVFYHKSGLHRISEVDTANAVLADRDHVKIEYAWI